MFFRRAPAGETMPLLIGHGLPIQGFSMRTRLYSLDELNDIPGTTVFNAIRSRQAYHLHKFCMSLMQEANRQAFKEDERAYLDRFRMSEEQKQAVLDRNFTKLIDLGGNIYFLVKLSNTDGWSTQKAVSSMTGMTPDEYAAMMRSGGRSPKGQRSIRGKN
jgi:protocatechuate 4,5-dioxygenase, alpha chain